MRRLLAQHRFSNRARIAVYQVAREHGVPRKDTLLLAFQTHRGKWFGTHMRADEALLVIEKLAKALYRSIRGWKVEKMRKRKGRH